MLLNRDDNYNAHVELTPQDISVQKEICLQWCPLLAKQLCSRMVTATMTGAGCSGPKAERGFQMGEQTVLPLDRLTVQLHAAVDTPVPAFTTF
jgi:hypothetical protein